MDFKLTPEQEEFRKSLEKFCAEQIAPNSRAVDESDSFPLENWKKLAALGFFGLMIPEAYGGQGKNLVAGAAGIFTLATACPSTAQAAGTSMFCCGKAIEMHGTDALKGKILPAMAKGGAVGALAVSEPGAGSDVSAITTAAVKKNGSFVISGSKTWITNAPVADIFVVLAKTGEKFSALAVPKGAAGLSVGEPIKTMGMCGAVAADVKFENVEVPAENLIGAENAGFGVIMDALDYTRLSVSAVANGVSAAAFKVAKEHAETREAFGKPLAAHQLVAFRVTDIHVEMDVARMLMYNAAWQKQQGMKCSPFIAIAKVSASESAVRNTNRCMNVLAGSGFARSSPAQRLYRDAKLTEIAGGAADILRQLIARDLLED